MKFAKASLQDRAYDTANCKTGLTAKQGEYQIKVKGKTGLVVKTWGLLNSRCRIQTQDRVASAEVQQRDDKLS